MKDDIVSVISPSILKVENHSLYQKIQTIEDLRFFMQRHVFAVLDFMSLTKHLQSEFASTQTPWVPPKSAQFARFINEIVLCEESDELPDGRFLSHFEIYLLAMEEIGAETTLIRSFVKDLREHSFEYALKENSIPSSASEFMQVTMSIVQAGHSHEVAASFCFGREKVIPQMFESLLQKMGVTRVQAPMFYFYLERHIEVDGDSHGPMAVKMIDTLCDNQIKKDEAMRAAITAINARYQFWNGIESELHLERNSEAHWC